MTTQSLSDDQMIPPSTTTSPPTTAIPISGGPSTPPLPPLPLRADFFREDEDVEEEGDFFCLGFAAAAREEDVAGEVEVDVRMEDETDAVDTDPMETKLRQRRKQREQRGSAREEKKRERIGRVR